MGFAGHGSLSSPQPDFVERLEQARAGPLHRIDQRFCVRAVTVNAVQRDAARLGRERDPSSARCGHLGETAGRTHTLAAERAGVGSTRHGAVSRIANYQCNAFSARADDDMPAHNKTAAKINRLTGNSFDGAKQPSAEIFGFWEP